MLQYSEPQLHCYHTQIRYLNWLLWFQKITLPGLPPEKKNFQDTKIMENQDIFQDKFLTKTCIKQDKHGPKNSKIDKKAYLYVTNIGVNLTGNLVGSSPSQVRSPSLQNGGSGVSPPRKFWKSIFNLVHSDAFFSLSGQFRSFLPFFRTT